MENDPTSTYERALALQSILAAVCEGRSEGSDEYESLRDEFVNNPETNELVPHFVITSKNLRHFVNLISDKADPHKDQWKKTLESRRNYLTLQFSPLLSYLMTKELKLRGVEVLTDENGELVAEESTATTSLSAVPDYVTIGGDRVTLDGNPVVLSPAGRRAIAGSAETQTEAISAEADSFKWTDVDPPLEDEVAASAASSSWTGRLSRQEQARHILSFAPAALGGLRALLDEQERRLHNGPPEAIDKDSLQALKDLHEALGSLIHVAEKGNELDAHLSAVKLLSERVFRFAVETGELCIAGAKPLLASVPAAWGTWALLGLICSPATFALLGPSAAAAVAAGYFGLELKRPSAK